MSSNKCLPWKFICSFAGSSSPWNSEQREKIYVKTWTATRTGEKEEMKDNKPYILAVLRHIFDIFSSQISSVMETSDAILKH